ncbi:inactive dipeptidyl peptidase 10 isoform X1 [Culex quinquefasciatus]|uniref:inactive dipeptidyl peptidase 10 isoform X1 n=2 Tax=Culex quinquefasciatus TaxID=7176 RepID=UPI0018E37DBF|nr:inactive dipeptidyl peptidase 10 isoform X1 [Culex quinquefasciatus]
MNTVQSTGHANVRNKKDSQFEELTVSSSEKRNWRGIFIALLVIAAVLGLIVFSILLLSPEIESSRLHGKRIHLHDVQTGQYQWKENNGTWLNKHEFVFVNPDGGLSSLYVGSVYNMNSKVLMNNSTFRQLNADKYSVSPDQNFVLLYANSNGLGNTSYFIYELTSSNVFPLSAKEGDQTAPSLQHVLWAPRQPTGDSASNGEKGTMQGIAFVQEGDIYYKPKVQSDLICRITTNGRTDYILNGVPDWLYKEVEELKSASLLFSPDGQYLSYLSFNVSSVHQYQYVWYGDNDQYPSIRSIRYPKTNAPNPNVTVFVVNLSVLKFISQKAITVPSYISNESYVGGMVWLSPAELSITYTNREQNISYVLLCTAPNFNCIEIFSERAAENGWVLIAEKPLFITTETDIENTIINATNLATSDIEPKEDGKPTVAPTKLTKRNIFMLKRLDVRDGSHGYFRQIALIPIETKRPIILTIGQYEVTEIFGYDEIRGFVYFMAAPHKKPGQRHLYRINLTLHRNTETIIKAAKDLSTFCMTCEFDPLYSFDLFRDPNKTNGLMTIPNNCLYNKIYFNTDYTYYVQECLGPESPSSYIVDAVTGKKIFILDDGNHLRKKLAELAKPQIMTFSVEIKYDFNAQVKLFLPPGIKEDDDMLLPLILHVDATPESQLVSEKYSFDWNWYLCSYQSYIIAQIDARGSGYQGEALKTQIRGKVGIEVEDQLSVLTYLRDNLKLVDPNRICAYGWGYGGYIVSMMLASDSENVLKCGAAINPIVSFKYYNSFFTERYVIQPADNGRALLDSDLSMKVGNFASKKYLLIHGTADTQVHEQHTAILTKSLIEVGVMFRHQVYVDENHSLSGVIAHVYQTIEAYFEENFLNDNQDWTTAFFLSKT